MERRKGSFTDQLAKDWVVVLMEKWQEMGKHLEDLVIVADNASCHSKIESVFDGTPASLLRLGSYSPMLNHIENIWSKAVFPNLICAMPHQNLFNIPMPPLCNIYIIFNIRKCNCSLKGLK